MRYIHFSHAKTMRTVPSCLQRLFWISKETYVFFKRDLYVERGIYNDPLSLSHMKCLHFSHTKTTRTVPFCLQRLFWTLCRPCQKPKETCIYVKIDLYIDITYVITHFPSHIWNTYISAMPRPRGPCYLARSVYFRHQKRPICMSKETYIYKERYI